jgi:exopolysaccharide production protein ExoQ
MFATEQVHSAVPVDVFFDRVSDREAPPSVWQLVIAWVLLIPLFYIAANGTFIPHAGLVDTAATGQSPGTDALHKISIAFVSVLCFFLIAIRFPPVFALAQRLKIVLAFPLLAIFSVAWSLDTKQSLISGGILFIFTAFAIYIASRFPFQRQLELITLLAAIILPLSIGLALFVPSIGMTPSGWRGIFGHKQTCAVGALLLLITAMHWKCSSALQKIVRAACILMSLGLIVMSQSRTGWGLSLLAILLSAALWLLQRVPSKQTLLVILLLLPLAAAGLYAIYLLSPSMLATFGKDATLSQRTIIWAAAWNAAVQHPLLGYGFTAFWKGLYGPSQQVVLVAGWGLQQAQNGFLDVWLGIGLLGLGVFFLMVGQALRNAVRTFYSEGEATYVRWCIIVIICTLLYNVGESSIGLVNLNWFLCLLAVVGLSQAATRAMERNLAQNARWRSADFYEHAFTEGQS